MRKIDITQEEEMFFKDFVEVYLEMPAVVRQIIRRYFGLDKHGAVGLSLKKGKWTVCLKVDGEWYNLYTYSIPENAKAMFRELAALLTGEVNEAPKDEENDDEDDEKEDAEKYKDFLDRDIEELERFLGTKGVKT